MNSNPSAAPIATASARHHPRSPVLYSGDRSGEPAAPFVKVGRHVHRGRQLRRIGASAGGPDGLFHCDTRFLSRLELTDQRAAAAAARIERPRRQHAPGGRPHQPGHVSPAAGSCCTRTPSTSRARSSCGGARPISALAVRNHGTVRSDLRSRSASTAISPICSRCAATAAQRRGTLAPRCRHAIRRC